MKLNTTLFLLFIILFNTSYSYVQRYGQLLKNNWEFTQNDNLQASEINFDDSNWQSVTIPHDWTIYGLFD